MNSKHQKLADRKKSIACSGLLTLEQLRNCQQSACAVSVVYNVTCRFEILNTLQDGPAAHKWERRTIQPSVYYFAGCSSGAYFSAAARLTQIAILLYGC